jgi:hypothetical protein
LARYDGGQLATLFDFFARATAALREATKAPSGQPEDQ